MMMAITAVTVVTEPPGRVLAGIAAAGLLVFASVSWRARPKLAINGDTLIIGGWRRPRILGRNEVRSIRVTEFRRIGRKVRLLEIDSVDDKLAVLSRWDLGTDPAEVRKTLATAGY